MITLQERPRAVEVGHWHVENGTYSTELKKMVGRVKEVRFDNPDTDYIGLLHGFGVEGEQSEMYCFALIERADGTFDTPSATVLRLICPTSRLSGLA